MPEAVKDMKMYKSDLPARMGGRLSSVLDINARDGNMKKFSTYGSLGLIAVRLAVEGPISKDKSSFFVPLDALMCRAYSKRKTRN